MKNRCHGLIIAAMVVFAASFIARAAGAAGAVDANQMKGWEADSPYNKLYDVKEYEKFRAWVVGFKEEPPMPGMSPGTIMVVKDGDDLIDVQICPTWFAKPEDIGVKKGDRVKLKGVWAEVNGKDVFMASKIKKGDSDVFEFKVRLTKDGTPFWTMTKEQLAQERESNTD
jgi:hypothetical protein